MQRHFWKRAVAGRHGIAWLALSSEVWYHSVQSGIDTETNAEEVWTWRKAAIAEIQVA